MEIKLKDCPLCGAIPHLIDSFTSPPGVGCDTCMLWILKTTKELAINAWNCRTDNTIWHYPKNNELPIDGDEVYCCFRRSPRSPLEYASMRYEENFKYYDNDNEVSPVFLTESADI